MSCLSQEVHGLKQIINKLIRIYIHNKWIVSVIFVHLSNWLDSFLHFSPYCPILVSWCFTLKWLYPYNWTLLFFSKKSWSVRICPQVYFQCRAFVIGFSKDSLSKLLCKCLSTATYCPENDFYYNLLTPFLDALFWHSTPL